MADDPRKLLGIPAGRAGLRRIAHHPGLGGSRALLRRQLVELLERLVLLGLVVCALLAVGTVGYMVTEGASVRFGLVWALTPCHCRLDPGADRNGGQILKVLLIIFGVGTLFYALVTTTEFFVAGHLSGLLEERSVLRKIDLLRNHILICGFGRVGRQVARDLPAAGRDFVVLDNNPEESEGARRGRDRRALYRGVALK